MLPENYHYTEKKAPEKTCSNCEHRCIAFHLIAGTSFCNLHNAHTTSPMFHCCKDWVKDTREKPTWTQSIGEAFKMPRMEDCENIETFTLDGFCPTCKHSDKSTGLLYCNKYFEELKGTDRTCTMCEVNIRGKCNFYEPVENMSEAKKPPVTEAVELKW